MNPDVIFVGAGPVGLYAAIESKLKNPTLSILMFERHKTYTRNYTLLVDRWTFYGSHPDPEFQEIIKDFVGPTPTSLIESNLKAFAIKLGIQIQNEKITDPEALLKRYPTAHTLLGADGAHSVVREKMFYGEEAFRNNLQYIVEVKYKTKGRTSRVAASTYITALSRLEHLVSEQVGKLRDGHTPVSLFFFVDKDTYDQVRTKEIKQLKDLQPTTTNLTSLVNSIRPWMALRRHTKGEEIVDDNIAIAAVELSAYAAKDFAKITPFNKRIALLGDASSGVPYNRSFNAGIIRAIIMSSWIAAPRDVAEVETREIELLNRSLHHQVSQEISNISKVDTSVDIGRSATFIEQWVFPVVSGAVANADELTAMHDARTYQTNIFQRNPRTTIMILLFIALLIGLTIALSGGLALPFMGALGLGVAFAISLGVSSAFIGLTIGLFKAFQALYNYLVPPKDDSPQIFPWEEGYVNLDSLDADKKDPSIVYPQPILETAPPIVEMPVHITIGPSPLFFGNRKKNTSTEPSIVLPPPSPH